MLAYGISFVLFLALNKDKPHKNILNSLGARIFCFIKLSEIYLRKQQKKAYKIFQCRFSKLGLFQNNKKYTAFER